ncbi:unnamed protein product [Caenorhabditis brenneri]
MNSTSKETIKPSAETYLNKLYLDLYHLVNSVEKGSGSELTVRLRNVESDIAHFKETLKAIPDIGVEEGKQRKKIAALYKQIEKKDELLESLASFSLDAALSKSTTRQQSSGSEDK